jgi:SAM-dependent methyltransferase
MSPQTVEASYWYAMLPRLGSPKEFAAVRELLSEAGYDYAAVCQRLGVEHVYLFSSEFEAAYLERPIADRLDSLIRLLLVGRRLDRQCAGQWLGRAGIECLAALQLLVREEGECETWFAPVMAHPVPGGIVVCDRNAAPDGKPLKQLPADALYPGLFQNTLDFVARFPETACDRILEIGTGTGTAAIHWARFAREVWATDITARSVHFAEFNRRLAGIENMTVVEGDLYAPVEGMTFDRIACHPPYVPAKKSAMIFRDGGEDGEQITRAIIEGLPRFLRPGGLFWASFMISDRRGEPAERRIRRWMGEHEGEFDIGLAADTLRTAAETIAHNVLKGGGSPEELRYFGDLWTANQTEFLVHASVLIRRQDGRRKPVTGRMQTGPGFTARHLEWLLDWQLALRQPGFVEGLLDSRPLLAPVCELAARHRLERGTSVSEQFTLEAEGPIRGACRCPGWLVQMLTRCDGTKTAREHFTDLRANGAVPPHGDPREFAIMLAGLVSAGLLTVESRPSV